MRCSAVQCSAVRCRTVGGGAVQRSTAKYSAVQRSAVHYSAVWCGAVRCGAATQLTTSPTFPSWSWFMNSPYGRNMLGGSPLGVGSVSGFAWLKVREHTMKIAHRKSSRLAPARASGYTKEKSSAMASRYLTTWGQE